MKRIVVLLAGLCLLVSLFATPVFAAEVPPLPHAFYGTVEINGSSANVGTTVEVRGEEVRTGIKGNPITVTEAGKYGGPGGLDPKLVVQGFIEPGTTLTFYVNGVEAETDPATVYWDSGEISVVNLSATITVTTTGGGGGVGDTTPPVISSISHCYEGITETTADICWITNEPSTSQVEYWASPSMLSPLDATLVTEHHVELTVLTPGTTYHYRTMSRDAAGNRTVSDEYTFTTLGEAPEAPPPEEAPPAPPPEEAPPAPAPPAPPAPPPTVPPEVKPLLNWTVIGGIIAGVVIVGLLIFFLTRRRAY